MFGPKPGEFGQTSTAGGIGSNTATASPFGQTNTSGKPATEGAFGTTPASGQQAAPSLFGQTQPAGASTTAAMAFGAPITTQQSGLGAIGQPQQQTPLIVIVTRKNTAHNTSPFGSSTNNSAFGATKLAGCGEFNEPTAETSPGQASISQTAQCGGLFGAQKPAFGGVAKPMSLKPVPVCSSCNRSTENCISCTSCYEMCCVICFNLQTDLTDAITKDDSVETVRLCPKCIGSIGIKQEPLDQPCTSAMDQDSELCELHSKPHKLFCFNCSMCICGDCLNENQHEMHHVNSFAVVYQEKLAEVELKLADAEKELTNSSIYERNLEKLENEEQSIMREVVIMKQKSISGLSSLTAKRKATLKSKVQFYADKRKRLSKLRETVKKLTAKDFLTKRSVIERQCDDMMVGCTPNCDLEQVDDLKCDLIPSYTFVSCTCPGFTKATSYVVFRMISAYDVAWNVSVSKSLTALQVKLNPSDPGILNFAHKLVVIIPHEDPTKEIRKTFDLGGGEFHRLEIVEMSHLTEHGFFNEGGNILLRIGVRPLDALVEKMLLSYNCDKLKGDCSRLKVETSSLKVENVGLKTENVSLKIHQESITSAFDYKHCTSYFEVNPLLKYDRKSSGIFDEAGRHWVLKITPTMSDGRTQLGAYIELIKGSPTKCNFFVELKHQDVQKKIVKWGTSNFDKGTDSGWRNFISWNKIADFPKGNLNFRYGVKPLSN